MTSGPVGLRQDLAAASAYLVAGAVAGLGDAAALAAVRQATGSPRALRELHHHLTLYPGAVLSGSSDGVPPSLIRLAKLLSEQGFRAVRVPGCLHCGRTDSPLPARTTGGRLCQPCQKRATAKTCNRCGQLRPVQARAAEGPLCARCAGKPRRVCGGCGRVGRIHTRSTDSAPDRCEQCVRWRVADCFRCGATKRCRRTSGGGMSCAACEAAARPPRECSRCRRQRPVRAYWPAGAVCGACYERGRANPRPCPLCGQRRVLIGIDGKGGSICGPCAGATTTYECVECGQSCEPFADGRCATRVLRERVQAILGTPPAGNPLAPLVDTLTTADSPRAVIRWLNGTTGRVLADLAATGQPLTHTALDRLPNSPAVRYLRSLLVHSGALEQSQDYLERVNPWLDRLLAEQPAHHATILRPYAIWDVMARARRRAGRRTTTSATSQYLRQKIQVAAYFLTWLDDHDTPLDELTQHHLDQYLAEGTSTRYKIRSFITWLRRRRVVTDVDMPTLPKAAQPVPIGEPDRWQQLQRCLRDETLPLHVRVAGALLLLYGNPVTHTVALTTDDIQQRGAHHYLTLAQHPVLLPPALAKLIVQLHDHAVPVSTLGRAVTSRPWLFPGRQPGTHRDGPTFTTVLAAHGIDVRPSRTAALMALAEQLPAAVFGPLLGLHPHTAVHWTNLVKRDWNDYIAARTDRGSHVPG
jgi:hypothetical protein